jgi:hypothetical protein
LPTPTTQESSGKCRDHGGDLLHEVICGCPRTERRLLPTPTVAHLRNHDEPVENYEARVQQWRDGELNGKPGVSLGVEVRRALFSTPTTMDNLPARVGEEFDKAKNHGGRKNRVSTGNLREEVVNLLPTPLVDDSKNDGRNENRYPTLASTVVQASWGKYEPAIRRWEQIINTPAPNATIPDGREGNHRLNPEFAEWLMGIPGRLDDCDLTRAERLKMAGNGVCPQQAELALTILIERLPK